MLCAYLYHDGLLRFATSPYGQEGGDLTNYSLNEGNTDFVEDDEVRIWAGTTKGEGAMRRGEHRNNSKN